MDNMYSGVIAMKKQQTRQLASKVGYFGDEL